jgi:hypothetical protein
MKEACARQSDACCKGPVQGSDTSGSPDPAAKVEEAADEVKLVDWVDCSSNTNSTATALQRGRLGLRTIGYRCSGFEAPATIDASTGRAGSLMLPRLAFRKEDMLRPDRCIRCLPLTSPPCLAHLLDRPVVLHPLQLLRRSTQTCGCVEGSCGLFVCPMSASSCCSCRMAHPPVPAVEISLMICVRFFAFAMLQDYAAECSCKCIVAVQKEESGQKKVRMANTKARGSHF